MGTAVIYARLSDVRKGDTQGIERQIREAEAHAKKLGVKVVDRLVDNDLSAAKKKARPAFEQLMVGIASDQWDTVILRSLDRWVRRPAELERIIEVVEKSHVTVAAIHGEIDLRTRNGRLNARVVTAVAMNEVEAAKERVTDWHRDRVERGLPMPGSAGYGFEADKTTVNKAEAKQIREAARRVLNGESLQGITKRWNANGVPFRDGRPWRPSALRRILLAPRTAGLRGHNGTITGPAAWPAILDRETFDRVGKVLTNPARRTADDRSQKLLTGILTCGVGFDPKDNRPRCGKPLNSKTTRDKGQRYYCRHCLGTLVAADHVEAFVFGALLEAVDGPELAAAMRRLRSNAGGVDRAAEVARLERDLVDLAHELGEGNVTMAEWKAARAGIEKRLTALRAEVGTSNGGSVLARWVGKGGELEAAWKSLPHKAKREIVSAVFDDIVVMPAKAGFNRFDSGRVQLVPSGWGRDAAAA